MVWSRLVVLVLIIKNLGTYEKKIIWDSEEGLFKKILVNFPFESLQQPPSLALLLTQVNIYKLNSNRLRL